MLVLSRIRWLRLSGTLAVLIIPLLLFLTGEALQTMMLHNLGVRFVPAGAGPPDCSLYKTTEICAQLLKGEMLYAALWLLNIVGSISAIAVATSVIYNVLEQPEFRFAPAVAVALVSGLAVGIVAAFVWSWVVWSALGWSNKYHLVLQAALGGLMYTIPPFAWHAAVLDASLYVTTFMLAISGTFVAVGCAVASQDLPPPPVQGTEATSGPSAMSALADRLQALKRVSLAGAILLITGVLQGQFYQQLPMPYLQHAAELVSDAPPRAGATLPTRANSPTAGPAASSPPPNGGNAYKSYIDGLATIQGIEFTLMLLAAFAIPALVIRHRAAQVAKLTAPKLTPPIAVTKYVQDTGFAFALPGYFSDLVTIAAPAIVGSLSPLIKIASST